MEWSFEGELFRWEGDSAWYFVRLPAEVAEDVREHAPPRTGFGSMRVTVTIGESRWQTSLFPESRTGSFLLPVKQQVRRANGVDAGDAVSVRLALAD